MELREKLSRRPVKFLTLLLTALLVATASAAMYYSLTMTSTITVYKANVYFVEGSDNATSTAYVYLDSLKTTATLTGLRAYPNLTFTYSNLTMVRNNATSGMTQIRLAPDVAPSGNATDFVYVKFMLNGTSARWLNYTVTGGSWNTPSASNWITIGTSTQWPIVIITKANATATVGNQVTIGITVDVD